MSVASDIVDALDALILAKTTGATSLSELQSRKLAEITTDLPKDLMSLLKLRDYYNQVAVGESGTTEMTSIMVDERVP